MPGTPSKGVRERNKLIKSQMQADRANGLSYDKLAKKYNKDKGTVQRWMRELRSKLDYWTLR